MGVSIEMTKAYFDTKGWKYDVIQDGKVLSTGVGGLDNIGSVNIYVIFDDDGKSVGIRAFDICRVPDNKLEAMYKTCSQLNAQFRWVKFYVDKDNSITAEDDAVIQPDSSGEEVFELVIRMGQITDGAYSQLMKTLWS